MKARAQPLTGQVAVISGGAGDIGRAIARTLYEQGARIALGDVQTSSKVRRQLARYHYTTVDVADAIEVDAWLARIERDLGRPTLIISNAAVVEMGGALDVSADDWRRTIDVNLSGAFTMAQLAARRLIAARQSGRVVFIGSWAAHAPHPKITAYCAAKAGLRMAMQCLALELAPHDILVNEIAPGRVDAGLSRKIFDDTPGLRERVRSEVPLRALLDPNDVARAVAYLCQPQTRQMTGSILLLDGGLSLVRPV